jgi:hypothetical protein
MFGVDSCVFLIRVFMFKFMTRTSHRDRFSPKKIKIPEYSHRSMQATGGSTELAANGAQIKTVCCIKCASHEDLICYGDCLHVLCAGCSRANLLCPVGGCGGKDPLSLHQLDTLPGWRHLTLDSSAFAEGMAPELSTIGNRLLQNAQVSRANGPVSNARCRLGPGTGSVT